MFLLIENSEIDAYVLLASKDKTKLEELIPKLVTLSEKLSQANSHCFDYITTWTKENPVDVSKPDEYNRWNSEYIRIYQIEYKRQLEIILTEEEKSLFQNELVGKHFYIQEVKEI